MSVLRTVAVFAVLFSLPALGLSKHQHGKHGTKAHPAKHPRIASARPHATKKAAKPPATTAAKPAPQLAQADLAPTEARDGSEETAPAGSRRVVSHSTAASGDDDTLTVR